MTTWRTRSVGFPRHARQVGYALHALRESEESVPWHRIVNSQGEVSPRSVPGWDEIQRVLLENENVEFDARGRIDLGRYQWPPRSRRKTAARPRR